GVGAIARAVPWAGLATGAALALAGLLTLLGRQLRLPTYLRVQPRREQRLGAMLLFGVGYGAASLGCTLPLFLTLLGASRRSLARASAPRSAAAASSPPSSPAVPAWPSC